MGGRESSLLQMRTWADRFISCKSSLAICCERDSCCKVSLSYIGVRAFPLLLQKAEDKIKGNAQASAWLLLPYSYPFLGPDSALQSQSMVESGI